MRERFRGFIKDLIAIPQSASVIEFNRINEDCINHFFTPRDLHRYRHHDYKVHINKITVGKTEQDKFYIQRLILFPDSTSPLEETYQVLRGKVVKIRKSLVTGSTIGSSQGEVVTKKGLEEIREMLNNIKNPFSK